ncbi:MAG: pseudouridine-5'-phosphate glycosidase [Pseudomonadota bacterium]
MSAILPLQFSEPVAEALAQGQPVVALESTIITHGLPSPRNLETAQALEAVVRARGAVPATIAVIAGTLHIGLEAPALAALATTPGVRKLSRADLAAAMIDGATGSTTVAATMIAARLGGIETFATGGIGGVHRGAETSFDISADLHELARTPVTVVAAGAKAILDLPKTLEVLETLGVPVIGYRTHAFPAFWSRESGLPVPIRMDTAEQIARSHRLRAAMGLEGGQLVAQAVPEPDEIPAAELGPPIEAAVRQAQKQGITGKEVTPFLLERVLALTEGRSLEANIALILNNAALGAEIAISLAKTQQSDLTRF